MDDTEENDDNTIRRGGMGKLLLFSLPFISGCLLYGVVDELTRTSLCFMLPSQLWIFLTLPLEAPEG